MADTNWDEMIKEFRGATTRVLTSDTYTQRSEAIAERDECDAKLRAAIAELERERDNLKTVLHGNQDADYDKQLQIETLKSQLAEAEADAKTTIKSEYAFVVCEKCRTAIPPQMLNFKYEFCPACGRKITRKEGK